MSRQVHELDAAVMVVDVSGFSGMCERFAQGLVPSAWRQRINVRPLRTKSIDMSVASVSRP